MAELGRADDVDIGIPSVAPSEPQILLVLVGLPGSGKSTFAEFLVDWSHRTLGKHRRWTRASQDEAPSKRRQECEAMVRSALERGDNVIVDRVDFDPVQRSHFILIAENHNPRPQIYALTLMVSIPTLQRRLVQRPYHPTIPDADTGLRVLGQMAHIWDAPRPNRPEGFDRLYILDEGMQPSNGVWGDRAAEVILDIGRNGAVEFGERVAFTASRGGGSRGRGRGEYRGRSGRGGWDRGPWRDPAMHTGSDSRGLQAGEGGRTDGIT